VAKLKKVYLENEIEMKLYGRIDTQGPEQLMCVSHVILNGQRYYPEDLPKEINQVLSKLLVQNQFWPFQFKSP
jgi:hypothetical protein